VCVLLSAGCGDDGTTVAGDSSTTGTAPSSTTVAAPPSSEAPPPPAALAPPSPEGAPPAHWYAVEHRGNRFVLVRGSTEGDEVVDLSSMADDFGVPDTSIPVSASDLAVTDDGADAFVAFCCEPVSGAVFRFPTTEGATAESFDMGDNLDVGAVYVRADTTGVLRWTDGAPSPTDDRNVVGAGAVDVAIDRTGGAIVAALVPAGESGGFEPVGEVVRTYDEAGDAVEDTDLGGVHCALVGTAEAFVATVGTPRPSAHGSTCIGNRFTVASGGATADVELAVALQDLETDATGSHLVGVDEAGDVVRIGAGDEVVSLTHGRDFVAVDW
jgi:hypothetical protein